MAEEGQKSGIHIHTGGLIFFIIILLILFKVNIKSVTESPQFKKNIAFIEEKAEILWNDYLSKPLTNTWNNLFSNFVNEGVKSLKNNALDNFKISDIDKDLKSIKTRDLE